MDKHSPVGAPSGDNRGTRMEGGSFSLCPLPGSLPFSPECVSIKGTIRRRAGTLSLYCELSGSTPAVAIPAPAVSPVRKHALWEETCFEFFLAEKDAEPYREFNISPTGDWNVYSFSSYRQGMREELSFSSLPVTVEARRGLTCISLEVDLRKIRAAELALDACVSAVVKTTDGSKTYWALVHPGARADFHRRDGFVLKL